jgi:glycosyltransferase involved in cell wall biosynthesis
MRIAFVDHRLNLQNGGGSNLSLHHMASALTDLGHDVLILTLAPKRNAIPEAVPYQVAERGLTESFIGLRGKLKLVSILREMEREVDVIQLEGPSFILSGALYRFLGGSTPVVARLNNYSFFCTNIPHMKSQCWQHCTLIDRFRHRPQRLATKLYRSPFHLIEQCGNRVLVNQVDRFIAMSPAVADIHARYGIAMEKMTVISSPLDYTALTSRLRPDAVETRRCDEPFRILFAGRLETQKGVDLLLQAVAGLEFPFTLDVVGDGPQRDTLQQLASDLSLTARVTFHGWRSQAEVIEFCLASQLFVHPGRWPEPSGRAVMDAVVLGVPLIVSNIGGPPWVAGEAALTFIPDDSNDLQEKIRAVHHDPALAARLSLASKGWMKQFDRRHVAHQLVDLYTDLSKSLSEQRVGAGQSCGDMDRPTRG